MGKQYVIQVPVNDELYCDIVALAEKCQASRAEIMREAFVSYNRKIRESELDRKYREGYERIPDDSKAGAAQVSIAGKVLSREQWIEKK